MPAIQKKKKKEEYLQDRNLSLSHLFIPAGSKAKGTWRRLRFPWRCARRESFLPGTTAFPSPSPVSMLLLLLLSMLFFSNHQRYH